MGRSGHRSYKHVEFVGQGTTGFVWCSFSIPRLPKDQTAPRFGRCQPTEPHPAVTQSSWRHPAVGHASPSSKAVSLQLRFIKAARSTCCSEQQTVLLINQSKGCWNIIQHLRSGNSYNKRGCENHHIPQAWNQPSWEYVHSTTIKNSSNNY